MRLPTMLLCALLPASSVAQDKGVDSDEGLVIVAPERAKTIEDIKAKWRAYLALSEITEATPLDTQPVACSVLSPEAVKQIVEAMRRQ